MRPRWDRSLEAVLAEEKGLLPPVNRAEREARLGAELEKIAASSTSSADTKHAASLAACYEEDRQVVHEQVERFEAIKALVVVVPGNWKRMCTKWQWVARAKEFDVQQRLQYEQELYSYLADEGRYITKAQRLTVLDMLVSALFAAHAEGPFKGFYISKEDGRKAFLAWVKAVQSVLKDIRKEMSTTDLVGKGRLYED